MFTIQTTHMHLYLDIVPVTDLRQHEQIIPQKAEQLVFQLRNWALLHNPVIVDEKFTVIDGHHRAFCIEKLNFRYIPVCKIDYFNHAVKLRYWFRCIPRVRDTHKLKRLLRALNVTMQPVADMAQLEKVLEKNRLYLGVQHRDRFFFIAFPEEVAHDAVSAYHITNRLQNRLLREGDQLEYIPCQSVLTGDCQNPIGKDDLILWTPQISKEMVMEAVNRKKRFTPKATRHLIPARPLNVNLPMNWLKGDVPLEIINEKFFAFLRNKGLKRFPPGQIIDGRYYEEELFVFFNKRENFAGRKGEGLCVT